MSKRQDSKRRILTTQNKENVDNTYSKKHSKNQYYSTKNSQLELAEDQELLQIIAKQKKEINQLKQGCQRCNTKQNSEIQLRNKILQQNTQILQLLSVEMPQIDIDLKLQIDALRDQLQQVTELNVALSQENTILRTLCENRENISSRKNLQPQQKSQCIRCPSRRVGLHLSTFFNLKCCNLRFRVRQKIKITILNEIIFMIKKVTCFGAGYVGGPTMAVMADKCPNQLFYVFDINEEQIQKWNNKDYPVYEQNLDVLISKNLNKNLFFTSDIELALSDCDIALIAVNTPSKNYGYGSPASLDISYIDGCVRMIQKAKLTKQLILVEKSTVPVKTSDYIKAILNNPLIKVISNPEFLAEGSAIQDLLFPDRIIIGGEEEPSQLLASLYLNWVPKDRIIFTNIYSSELSKIVANSFLAQRISSINSISAICEKIGADVNQVAKCIGSDSRIGNKFLQVSVGFGGSCLKKDLLSLIYLCETYQLDQVAQYWKSVYDMNEYQKNRFSNLIISTMFNNLKNKIITIFGITFKANTNDTRESAALDVMQKLEQEQAILQIYDPKGKSAKHHQFQTPEDAIKGSHAIIILTEWEEFKTLDYERFIPQMERPAYLFDGRNLLSPDSIRKIGFLYYSLGQ